MHIRAFLTKHKRHIPTLALFAGFVWDFLTLGRPDRLFDNVVLLFYLLLAGAGILLMSRKRQLGVKETPLSLLVVIQFAFGNLASALFVLYSVSGTLAGSWFFFLILAALLVGNEFFRDRYGLFRFTINIYYLLVLSYFVLIIPVLLREIGSTIFLYSGAASIIAITLFLLLVRFIAPDVFSMHKNKLFTTLMMIFFGFNILYFFNIIPPVPLALKEIGIYHNVEREAALYRVSYEKPEWYEVFKRSDTTFHFVSGDSAYCFSSVFAPTEFTTAIYHRWERYDKEKGWQTETHISFPLSGGRDEGFRGFSTKRALSPGRWRCSVETEQGALIGRRSFEIVESEHVPELVFETR